MQDTITQHTPGPWEFGGNFGPKDDVEIWHNADLVAMVSNQTELDMLLANARLIAAAPELLEALEALVDVAGVASTPSTRQAFNAEIKRAVAVIRKACGG